MKLFNLFIGYFLFSGAFTWSFFSDTTKLQKRWCEEHKDDADYTQKYNEFILLLETLDYGRPMTDLICLFFGWLLMPLMLWQKLESVAKKIFKIK